MNHELVMNRIPVGRNCSYDGIEFTKDIIFPNGRKLIVFAYRAYNACGLIGPENNGIGILDVTKMEVLADQIGRSGSYTYNGMTDYQISLAEEIAGYDWDAMCLFVNNCGRNRRELEEIKDLKKFRCSHFKPAMFTPTKFQTAKDKAKFANHFIRFILSDYDQDLFKKWFYERLSMSFGHIAHYDRGGFYNTFFRTGEGKQRFAHLTMKHSCAGDPAYTYSDVEIKIQEYLLASDHFNHFLEKGNLCKRTERS